LNFQKKKEGLARTALFLVLLLAVSLFGLSGQAQPLDPEVLRAKADAFLAQEDYANALAAYQELIAVAETQTLLAASTRAELKNYARYRISLAYYQQRDYQEAIQEADQIESPYLDYAYYLKGYCCQTTGQYQEATQWFEKLTSQFPNSILFNLARFQLARTLYFQGNRLAALLAFSRLPKEPQDYSPIAPETAGQVEENIKFIVEQLKVKK